MKQKCYVSKSKIHCGPCAFINLIGLKGTPKLEERLSSIGRIKPFHASDYTSFLIWAQIYNKDVEVYTTSKKLNDKMLRLMIRYEKIPKNRIKDFKKRAMERHQKLNNEFSNKIRILKKPLQKLIYFLDEGYKVAILTSDYYSHPKNPVPHWIVAFKRMGNKYYFMDSAKGIISLTKQQLERGFEINKKDGFNPQLVVYKKLST